MKIRNIFLLLLTTSLVASCGINNSTNPSNSNDSNSDTSQQQGSNSEQGKTDTSSDTQEEVISTNIQDANILHAWNWKMIDIQSRLDVIKNAGYEAVQISPMQPKMDKTGWSDQTTKSQWWKLYQPLAFKVSGDNENFLGTKSDLTALCTAAKAKGIKIVADVVCNHLAGDKNGNYNDQVYTKYPQHSWNGGTDDNNGESVVKGRIGLPDLDTSNSQVQNAVLEMLKEYLDCGVTGFRFDAAKHIETPDDGSYASKFWTTVLDGTTQYAKTKGYVEPYYYGEVLNTPGNNRSWSSYTKMMSVCDNKQGTAIVNAVKNGQASSLKTTYDTGVDPDHLVLWSESHDTYANDEGYDITRSFSKSVINKAYMIQASRKDAATLYLARQEDIFSNQITQIYDDTGWNDKEIKAINDFHTHYVSQSEHITIQKDKYFVNVRGSGAFAGAAIINLSSTASSEINVAGLQNGEYTDLVSGSTFTVNNGTVNVSFTNGACILVPKGSVAPGGDSPAPTTVHNVLVTNAVSGKYYYAWVFGGSAADRWIKLTEGTNGFGFDIGTYTKYIIVEFDNDSPNWSNKNWQSVNLDYNGGTVTVDCNTVQRA